MSPNAAEMYTMTPMMLLRPTGEICQHKGFLEHFKQVAINVYSIIRNIANMYNLTIEDIYTVKDNSKK